jgi:hypothetical protein
VGTLGDASALVDVEEDVVDVLGGGDEGLVVCLGHCLHYAGGGEVGHGPQTLADGAQLDVELDFAELQRD